MKKIILKRRTASSDIVINNIHPLLNRIYNLRGIRSHQELDHSFESLLNFKQLHGIQKGVELLFEAIKQSKKIVVIGDFDADGATSTALIIKTLRNMGATFVDYIIPDRFTDGYGLSINVVKHAIAKNADVIITVDTGVSSFDGVDYAHEHNLQVIVTDHHLPSNKLPNADAIINPNLSECCFPSKHLAGVGVALYFMLALRAHLREVGWFEEYPKANFNLASVLDLVALGTIADVVVLDHNNRILVQQGLNRIRAGRACAGINALIEVAQKNREKICSADLGFVVAPRLNAAGRMENMSLGVELLLTNNEKLAKEIAAELDELNADRRAIEQSMQTEALLVIQQVKKQLSNIPNGIVLYNPEWHQGIIGILSSRIKDNYHRPVFSFAAVGDGTLKGSGRSINGFHLRDALERLDTLHPEVIDYFGGHAMAAGLTIHESKFEQFKIAFEALTAELLDDTLLNNVILSDGELTDDELNCNTAELLQDAVPWGQGFPRPLFDGEFIILQQRLVGEKHLKLTLQTTTNGVLIDAIAFNIDRQCWPDPSIKKVQVVYNLDVNEFRGNKTAQLLVQHLWPVD